MDVPAATTEISKKITAINKEAIHRICSGQIVLNLAVAVKELVENSLDSGATFIEVKLVDYGKTCITVIDNGYGVLERDFEGLGLKHHTSKLKEFSDLLELETFGFRGEALSSLCSLSNLNIITRHYTSQFAFNLQFDKNGILVEKNECARQQGTTVIVRNIFKNLPVRAKEFERNIKKEFTKMIQVLYSYCLVCTGVKLSCKNIDGNKSDKVIVATFGLNNVLDNITTVFGRKARQNLIEIKALDPDKDILDEYNLPADTSINFTWECYVSSCCHTLGRSASDRQFFYVNGRPCDPTKISKLINYIYHKYNNKQYPFVYLNIQLDKNCADVNITPDKRTILFTQEKIILATIKSNFEKVWKDMQGTFTVKTLDDIMSKVKKRTISDSPENSPPLKKSFPQKLSPNNNSTQSVLETIKIKLNKFKSKEEKINLNKKETIINKKINHVNLKIFETNINDINIEKSKQKDCTNENLNKKRIKYFDNCEMKERTFDLKNETFEKNYEAESSEKERKIKKRLPDTKMIISLQMIKTKLYKQKSIQELRQKTQESRLKYRTELNSKATDVEKEFERELTRESFEKMQIIGQFNLGFIITKLNNDIFIFDQHASDEKFRFEKLSTETKLKTQKLIIPKSLSLSILNESILIDNKYVFENNGFTFDIKMEEDPGKRIKLTGIPVSFDWQFDLEDIEELIFLIKEGGSDGTGSNIIPRPSRVRQMLASRACRGAVMIGKALNFSDMHRLVTQMSELKNPWNCPHGRPTLRHLISLTLLTQ